MIQNVEILLATYNGEPYLRQQIDSILVQSNEEWHLTISDDGSTDVTTAIIEDYEKKHPDKIKRHISGCRFGNARDHFYHLMKHCAARFMFFCDQDDVWYPEKIEKMLIEMQKAEKEYGQDVPLLVFSDQTPTDAQLNPLAPSLMRYQNQYFERFDYRSILMQNVVTGGAMCINRALAELAMQCKTPEKTMMHDWWLAVVAARFGRIVYMDEPLGDYRQHGTNHVGAKDVNSLAHIVHKITNLNEISKTLSGKKGQAQVFLQTYAGMLGDDDRAFLEPFVNQRSGPFFYWKNRELIHGFFRLAGMMALG